MTGQPAVDWLLLPIAFGLLGFVEPCSIGSTLVFIKTIEDAPAAIQMSQTVLFAISRALVLGLLGGLAAAVGLRFFAFQHLVWVGLGGVYLMIGVAYLTRHVRWLMRPLGPGLAWLSTRHGSIWLGLFFGLNVPACAVPLLVALLSSAFAARATLAGFVMLALFGVTLSLPIIAAVWFESARRWIGGLAALSRSGSVWTGTAFLLLGAWSIWSGLAAPTGVGPS